MGQYLKGRFEHMRFVDDARIPEQPYPELRDVLNAFAEEISAELGENLVGIYLVGSIASGDFDLDSDVDFLVVTRTELTGTNRQRLQNIQGRMHEMSAYPAQHLEGSYISLGDLNDTSAVGKKELYYFDNGSTTAEQSTHDNKWHVRWVLRERGVTLIGQSPGTLLPSVPPEAMRAEIEADEAAGRGLRPPPSPAFLGITDPELAAWMTPRITPHPLATYDQPAPPGNARSAAIPGVYIHCTSGPTTPVFAPFTEKARLRGWDVHTMAAGHVVMMTAPDDVADLLVSTAEPEHPNR